MTDHVALLTDFADASLPRTVRAKTAYYESLLGLQPQAYKEVDVAAHHNPEAHMHCCHAATKPDCECEERHLTRQSSMAGESEWSSYYTERSRTSGSVTELSRGVNQTTESQDARRFSKACQCSEALGEISDLQAALIPGAHIRKRGSAGEAPRCEEPREESELREESEPREENEWREESEWREGSDRLSSQCEGDYEEMEETGIAGVSADEADAGASDSSAARESVSNLSRGSFDVSASPATARTSGASLAGASTSGARTSCAGPSSWITLPMGSRGHTHRIRFIA